MGLSASPTRVPDLRLTNNLGCYSSSASCGAPGWQTLQSLASPWSSSKSSTTPTACPGPSAASALPCIRRERERVSGPVGSHGRNGKAFRRQSAPSPETQGLRECDGEALWIGAREALEPRHFVHLPSRRARRSFVPGAQPLGANSPCRHHPRQQHRGPQMVCARPCEHGETYANRLVNDQCLRVASSKPQVRT